MHSLMMTGRHSADEDAQPDEGLSDAWTSGDEGDGLASEDDGDELASEDDGDAEGVA